MKPMMTGIALASMAVAIATADTPAWSQSPAQTPMAYPTDVPSEQADKMTVVQAGERNKSQLEISGAGSSRSITVDQRGLQSDVVAINTASQSSTKIKQDSTAYLANANIQQKTSTWATVDLKQGGAARAKVTQHDGYLLGATITQIGSSTLDLDQSGSSNFAVIQQTNNPEATPADPANVTVSQAGSVGTVLVKQFAVPGSGSMNSTILATQTSSSSGLADVSQTGKNNYIDVSQSNGVQETTVRQSGEANKATVDFAGPAVVDVTQSGLRNEMRLFGGAWAGVTATVVQSGTNNKLASHQINTIRPVSYDFRQSGKNNTLFTGVYDH